MAGLQKMFKKFKDLSFGCACGITPVIHAVQLQSIQALRCGKVLICSVMLQGTADAYKEILDIDPNLGIPLFEFILTYQI